MPKDSQKATRGSEKGGPNQNKNTNLQGFTMWTRSCVLVGTLKAKVRQRLAFDLKQTITLLGRELKVNDDGVALSGWSNQMGQETVVEVTTEDWDELVNSKKHVLLFWYTPWCIRCLDIIKPNYIQVRKLSQIVWNSISSKEEDSLLTT